MTDGRASWQMPRLRAGETEGLLAGKALPWLHRTRRRRLFQCLLHLCSSGMLRPFCQVRILQGWGRPVDGSRRNVLSTLAGVVGSDDIIPAPRLGAFPGALAMAPFRVCPMRPSADVHPCLAIGGGTMAASYLARFLVVFADHWVGR